MKTERLNIHLASCEEMKHFISLQKNKILIEAYTEMMNSAIKHPEMWAWYAIWFIELSDGTHIGELCFKGVNSDGSTEIGYGICEEYQNRGYATEAVSAISDWALHQTNVNFVFARVEKSNFASIKVLEKCRFSPTGETDAEGDIYKKSVVERNA